MNNINLNLNRNYKPVFKSAEKDEKPILVDRLQQKFDYNFSVRPETQKRAFAGGLLAMLSCGAIALGDMTISGFIKAINGQIKFKDIINPKKSMSKIGKWTTAVVGAFIIIKNIAQGITVDAASKNRR